MIQEEILEHIKVCNSLMEKTSVLIEIGELIVKVLKNGNKVIFIGNGGSAADAQHLAAELSGRFRRERKGLAGLALTTDTSTLTAIGNDYGFDNIFMRQVEALGQTGDALISISTSGNSMNIINAARYAKTIGIKTVGFTGKEGGTLKEFCDLNLIIPSTNTARIQEMHILAGHILCEFIETHIS